ncbi:MAG: S-layer homology domain-containing protein [Clostridiales bacterium]|jgi:hypothetical protein|nr:S-layer homology domain-containing protein [Clostridiales bacterium]
MKRILSVVLCAAIAFTPIIGLAGKYDGTPSKNHWAYSYYKHLRNITAIYDGDDVVTRQPDDHISRGAFIRMLNRAFAMDTPYDTLKHFTDLYDDDKYFWDINQAYSSGIISGYPDGTVQPYVKLTRAEVAQIIYKKFGGNEYDSYIQASFTDYIPEWARPAVYSRGTILEGYPDGTFRPSNPITIAEAVKIVAALNVSSPDFSEGEFDFDKKITAETNVGVITVMHGIVPKDRVAAYEATIDTKNSELERILGSDTLENDPIEKISILMEFEPSVTIPEIIVKDFNQDGYDDFAVGATSTNGTKNYKYYIFNESYTQFVESKALCYYLNKYDKYEIVHGEIWIDTNGAGLPLQLMYVGVNKDGSNCDFVPNALG